MFHNVAIALYLILKRYMKKVTPWIWDMPKISCNKIFVLNWWDWVWKNSKKVLQRNLEVLVVNLYFVFVQTSQPGLSFESIMMRRKTMSYGLLKD